MRWAVLGRFPDAPALCNAGAALRKLGLFVDLHSPYPIPETSEALGLRPTPVRLMGLLGGLAGAGGAYLVAWFCNAIQYPINVGGRPLNSAPAFIPLTFEGMVLASATTIFLSFLAVCGLPKLYHPVFETNVFVDSSIDGLFASVIVEGAEDRAREVADELRTLGASEVTVAEDRSVQEPKL